MDSARAIRTATILLVLALFLRHSLLGVLAALAAAVPAGYATWMGSQEETQRTYLYGVLLLLGSLLLAAVLLIMWLF